jgi:hypothetical protein
VQELREQQEALARLVRKAAQVRPVQDKLV